MSLVGNLEDIGLGEILQIISLSRKSGTLLLQSRGREGRIVFRLGQVIRATSSVFQESLGELLIRKGKLDLSSLRAALLEQEREGFKERLGTILVRKFEVPSSSMEEVVREQIERVVYCLCAWVEGTFNFEVQEGVEAVDDIRMDPLQFVLEQGINPQFLAMEGSRIIDEQRQREVGVEPRPSREVEQSEEFAEENVDAAFDILQTTGHSVAQPATEKFDSRILADARATPEPREPSQGLVNLGEELRLEMGEEAPGVSEARLEPSTGLPHLRGMLEELNDPALGGGITLLVLRFAAEFMGRAVLFTILRDEVVGLGQFGLGDWGDAADERVRALRIPRGEPSLFTAALEARHPAVVRPAPCEWNRYLFDRLGGGVPDEVFLGPIVSEGESVAILYGDNLFDRKPIAGTEALEIFLSQAGMAMERALLERKLMENVRSQL